MGTGSNYKEITIDSDIARGSPELKATTMWPLTFELLTVNYHIPKYVSWMFHCIGALCLQEQRCSTCKTDVICTSRHAQSALKTQLKSWEDTSRYITWGTSHMTREKTEHNGISGGQNTETRTGCHDEISKGRGLIWHRLGKDKRQNTRSVCEIGKIFLSEGAEEGGGASSTFSCGQTSPLCPAWRCHWLAVGCAAVVPSLYAKQDSLWPGTSARMK